MTQSHGANTSVRSGSAPRANGASRNSLWDSILRLEWPRWGEPAPAADGNEITGVHEISGSPSPASRRNVRAEEVTRWLYRLSPETAAFREQVKALLASDLFAPDEGLPLEERARRSYARFKLLREQLDLRLSDVRDRPARLAAALELVGVIDATLFTVMNIHYCLCGGSLLQLGRGNGELDGYIEELDAVRTIGTFLCTELGYGNNVVSLETRADYDFEKRELVLSTPCPEARKFMPNTGLDGIPKLGVVMARLMVAGVDHGVFPIVVPLRTTSGPCAGVSIAPLGDKPVYSLDNAITSFHGVRVPKHCLLLGEHNELEDDGTFRTRIPSRRARFLRSIEQVQLGRLCLSGVGATATAASAFIAINYGEQRRTFAPQRPDVSIIEYRNYQRDVYSALAYAYASRCLLDFAITKYVSTRSTEHDYLFRITGATKSHITYATERFVRLCRERCGAAGMFDENRLAVYASQAQGLVTAEGDNHIVLIKIARHMLLRQGYVRLAPPRQPSTLPLSEPERLLELVRERERRLLDQLRRAMAKARLPDQDLFALWNENINLAMETSAAHASRLALESFSQRAAELAPEHPAIDLLRLFGLQEIAPHLGYYLAEELITRDEVKTHGATLDLICKALRPHALELAAACDVPNTLLRAPLASEDYVACYDQRAQRATATKGAANLRAGGATAGATPPSG